MRKIGFALAAAALMGVSLPASTADAKPQFSGFSAEATATPLRIAIFEPVVPIPSEPQAELDLAYTRAESATGPSATGRASWLWPGDAVGEGCKTFVELLGAGDTGLCSDGYPVQVNSQTPGGPATDSDEPVKGSVMRTSSSADRTVAKVGWSTDGDVGEREPDQGGEGGPGDPGAPGVPELPVPLPGDLSQLGAAITGKQAAPSAPGDEEPPSSAIFPEELAALVDVGSMSSISELTTSGNTIRSVGTSRIADLSLLKGLITADSIRVVTSATSNGKVATSDITSRVVGLAVAGTPFVVDRDGVHAAGQTPPIPGLPDDPAKALEQLGISFEVPQGQRTAKGEGATAFLEGLKISIDTRVLRSQLDTSAVQAAVEQVTGNLPDDAAQLKSLVGALFQVAPKIVITAGNAQVAAQTIQGVTFPAIDLPSAPAGSSATGGGAAVSGSGSAGSGALSGGSGAAPVPAGDAGAAATTAVATEPVAAGLPALASIPGALLIGGLVLASGVGWWLQRIGGFVLGGAGACAHGLETGIPDLRKA
jgi:hypothetical protein